MFFFDVDGKKFVRFLLFAVHHLQEHAGTAHGELVPFAAHVFKKNREVQFTAAADFPHGFIRRGTQTHGNVGLQFAFQTFTNLAARHELAFATRERRRVHHEVHREGGFIHLQHRERFRSGRIRNRRTDVEIFDTVHKNDVACLRGIHDLAIQPFELQNLIDLRCFGRIVGAVHDHDVLPRLQHTAVHAADTDLTDVAVVVQGADLQLQRGFGVVFTHGNVLDDRIKDRAHVADLLQFFHVIRVAGVPFEGRSVNHREVQLIFRCTELIKEVERLVHHPFRTGTGTIHLVDDDDGL